ncbi:hypothetical protein E2C01_040780 [Portunus trituberculatus]|uniref:Uncharacterized protein n=1 Tax=Portunus trituberculatus TaxID=210409 RepID=A0A5B7FNK4_PORTR|nr:hypothetical protein [Portunus trituberculatus]
MDLLVTFRCPEEPGIYVKREHYGEHPIIWTSDSHPGCTLTVEPRCMKVFKQLMPAAAHSPALAVCQYRADFGVPVAPMVRRSLSDGGLVPTGVGGASCSCLRKQTITTVEKLQDAHARIAHPTVAGADCGHRHCTTPPPPHLPLHSPDRTVTLHLLPAPSRSGKKP